MAEDVQVEFGAKIEALDRGVAEAKSRIESIKESAEGLHEGFSKLAEVVGIAFTTEKIVEFVRSMGELGERTERMSAMLGVSAQSALELQGMATLTGTSVEGLAVGLERMSLNIQRSTRDAFNPTAQALKMLGLNAKELIGLPADEYFKRLADSVSRFEPSLNLTNALMQVGGRGIAQLIPTLREAGVSYEEFQARLREAQGPMAEQTKDLAESNVNMKLLGISAESLGSQMFTIFKPAIDGVVQSLSDMVKWFRDASSSGGPLADLFRILTTAAKAFATALATIVSTFEGLLATISLGVGLIEGQGEKAWDAWGKGLDDLYVHWKKTFDAIWHDSNILHVEVTKGLKVGAIDFEAKGGMEAAVEALKNQITAANAAFALEKDRLASMVKLHEITHSQETQALLTELAKRESAEEAAQNLIILQYQKGSKEYESAQAELTKIADKARLERQQINEKEKEENVKEWQSMLTPIQSAWDSQLRGLLAGTTTWATAMRNIVESLVMDIIKFFEKLAVEKAASALAAQFGSITEMYAVALKNITSSVGQVYAGEAAYFAPFLGPGAPAAAAGVAATVQTTAMALSGFEVGTDYVPRTGLALVHQGEAIVPAWQNPAAAAGITGGQTAGGSMSVAFNVSAMDSAGVQAFFNRFGPQIARSLSAHMNQNPSYQQ